MPNWATVPQVQALTGATVSALTLSMAKNAVEMTTGLIEDVERPDLTNRDRYWLRMAVCYQAAWLNAQPDYLERNSISSASQDGQSVTGGNADWLVLAPLARKAIKRLSWRGVRSIVPGKDDTVSLAGLNPDSDTYDDRLPWSPA